MASLTSPSHARKLTTSNGTTYGVIHHSPTHPSGLTLLFLHGYPSSSYDWRYQIETFSKLGYGLIVPDLLGYGDSDKPTSPDDYGMVTLGEHILELLDQLAVGKVVGIAHDWGCGLLAPLARLKQERFEGFVFTAVGYNRSGNWDLDAINQATTEQVGYPIFGYWKFHVAEDAAQVIEDNIESYFSLAYPDDPKRWITDFCPLGAVRAWTESGKIGLLPEWLNPSEHATHISILKKGGFTGPLNWYKQAISGVTYEQEKDQTDAQQELHKPVLYIGASRDYVCLETSSRESTKMWAKGGFEAASIEAGHWVNLEKRTEFDQALAGWLEKNFGA